MIRSEVDFTKGLGKGKSIACMQSIAARRIMKTDFSKLAWTQGHFSSSQKHLALGLIGATLLEAIVADFVDDEGMISF